jgi:hypothetical protein
MCYLFQPSRVPINLDVRLDVMVTLIDDQGFVVRFIIACRIPQPKDSSGS